MIDREKVVRAMECCAVGAECDHCPYTPMNKSWYEGCYQMHADALALLKEQEPNKDWISRKRLKDEIQYYIDEAGWGDETNKVLGWCMEFIDNQRAVKWE